ncbi:ERAD-associated protein [Coemansia brasiliensis]|uniref:ERAD-associated protein n=1 Tax=Coemansia brasiliensis TaxID=2650707 RepID=A0A9W8ICD6_9FUNG|nr:ERAD-associated protein [Coemansia brasiliensis]
MHCNWGLLAWLLASNVIASETNGVDTTDIQLVSSLNENSLAHLQTDEESIDHYDVKRKEDQESFEHAAHILRQFQALSAKKTGSKSKNSSPIRTYRDIATLIPKAVRPYVKGMAQLVARTFGLTDRVGEKYINKPRRSQPQEVQQAIRTIKTLAIAGHEDALFMLAEMEMYGKYMTKIDLDSAFEHYRQLADISGNATAQYMLGFFYATGLGSVEQQNSMALLYTTLAAIQGHHPAEVTLASKHLTGIGVPMSCEKALGYYQSVARSAILYFQSGPILGHHIPDQRLRLSDDNGGTYGVRTGPFSLHKLIDKSSFDELLLYHMQDAQKGHLKTCMTLVDLFYHGHRFAPRNYPLALEYLQQVLKQLMTDHGTPRKGLSQAETSIAAQAAGMYGIMHLRGEGTPVNTATALKWLNTGAKMGHGVSCNALGVMYRDGIEVPANQERAIELFKLAADRGHHGGQVNFALAVMDIMPEIARENLKKAADNGHILAHFYLAELYAGLAAGESRCQMAVASYKYVSEYGDWLHSPIPSAYADFQQGELDAAALKYMQAAEMGYGVGQLNAALLLEAAAKRIDAAGKKSTTSTEMWSLFKTRKAHLRQTLAYWTRAANSNMPDARVKQGDHYYYGVGVEQDAERAAAAYVVASEADANGLAMWNLGWMYENGIGVKRDFYLAKRWFDKSIEVNEGGKLANHLSLARLCIKYLWAWLRGEDVGESPLFFAPRPVTAEEEKMAQAKAKRHGTQDAGNADAQKQRAGHLGDDDWERRAKALDADDADVNDEDADQDDESLSGNLFFVILFLAAGWMFLPMR